MAVSVQGKYGLFLICAIGKIECETGVMLCATMESVSTE